MAGEEPLRPDPTGTSMEHREHALEQIAYPRPVLATAYAILYIGDQLSEVVGTLRSIEGHLEEAGRPTAVIQSAIAGGSHSQHWQKAY